MSLLESHSVVWSRYVQSGKDELGNFTGTTAMPGFPTNVLGQYEPKGSSGFRNAEGITQRRDAVFRSAWTGGRAGDFVTHEGVTYLVLSFEDNRQAVGVPHLAYDLVRQELGNRVKASTEDEAVIQERP